MTPLKRFLALDRNANGLRRRRDHAVDRFGEAVQEVANPVLDSLDERPASVLLLRHSLEFQYGVRVKPVNLPFWYASSHTESIATREDERFTFI